MNLKKCLLVLIAIACTFLPTMAVAETTECTVIASIPYVITQQGVYCLKSNLATSATSGNAIDIQTNNVTIDFNEFKLGNLGGGTSTQMNGVYAYEKKNAVIRNANIRGFKNGIMFYAGEGHIIQDSRFENVYGTAINIVVAGQNFGKNQIIERNRIINTGNETFGFAIRLSSLSSIIRDNFISGFNVNATDFAMGMYLDGYDLTISGNIISGDNSNVTAPTVGIYTAGGLNTIHSNLFSFLDTGIEIGMLTQILKDNLMRMVTSPYSGSTSFITDAGGNYPAIPAP